jgi:hypothetical protein
MTRKSYVKFVDDPRGLEVQTLRGETLGGIAWYARWQEHVFVPELGTVFSSSCMEDIVEMVKVMNAARKQERLAI